MNDKTYVLVIIRRIQGGDLDIQLIGYGFRSGIRRQRSMECWSNNVCIRIMRSNGLSDVDHAGAVVQHSVHHHIERVRGVFRKYVANIPKTFRRRYS